MMKMLYDEFDELNLIDYVVLVEGYVEEGGYRLYIYMVYIGLIRFNRVIEKFFKYFNCLLNFI